MASEKAKELAAKQKAARKAEKERKKNSTDPRDWGRIRQMVEAYKQTAKVDPSVTWWMIGIGLAAFAVVAVLGVVSNMAVWLWIPLGLITGVMAAMVVLTQKVKSAMIKRYEGQPGSAEVALQLLNNKKYTYEIGIAATRQLDLVHRVVGPSGIVLIGEGSTARVKPLLGGEARKHEQVSYGVPVTQLYLGKGEGQVPLGQLQKTVEKLPKSLKPHQVTDVRNRLRALDAVRPKAPIPRGPMPSPKGVKRAMRGR
ncbi:MAG: DUF4191 domain-containing protein [Propioniciclava sp.]|uniref:DUF4191 domain-containing protein n=1 Tax=Propioniciclava sp. TaxID=2038686 RepID=UPI0039E50079